MNATTIRAMVNEATKIAGAVGVAARFAKSVGKKGAKAAWKSAKEVPGDVAKNTKAAPGNVYKALRDMGSPIKSTKRGLRSEYKSIKDKGAKGVNLGHVVNIGGAAASAPAALSKEDRSGRGRSRTRRIVNWSAEQVGGTIGARHGLPGAIAGTMVANKLTNR